MPPNNQLRNPLRMSERDKITIIRKHAKYEHVYFLADLNAQLFLFNQIKHDILIQIFEYALKHPV